VEFGFAFALLGERAYDLGVGAKGVVVSFRDVSGDGLGRALGGDYKEWLEG
jgi:hypothetical protein